MHVLSERFLPINPCVTQLLYVDDSSPSLLRWRVTRGNQAKAGDVAGTLRSDGRWRVSVQGTFYYTYRIYFFLQTGIDPKNNLIDHKNGDSSDHSPDNLRLATRSQNNANRRKRNKYKGVSLHKKSGRWRARIHIDGKETTTYHETEVAAARAYDMLARKAHGPFACLNFPEETDVCPT